MSLPGGDCISKAVHRDPRVVRWPELTERHGRRRALAPADPIRAVARSGCDENGSAVTAGPSSRLRVAAFSGGAGVPSARLRVHQLASDLDRQGVELLLLDARRSSYPPLGGSVGRARWAAGELACRIQQIRRTRATRPDITLIQREFISTFPTIEGIAGHPLVFDVDDAIWLLRKGRAADFIAHRSEAIIAGNAFIADYFAKFAPVTVIPTAVDLTYYRPAVEAQGRMRIGWCGSSSGFKYLDGITAALGALMNHRADFDLAVMADRPPSLDLPPERVVYQPWSQSDEPQFLQSLSVGIMPLADGPWERGKCSYKMLSYLASGLPVVVSPVGMNADVLREAMVGYGPRSPEGWAESLNGLLDDADLRHALGRSGRALVEERYSTEFIASALSDALRAMS
jgi:hypothetical protein